MRTIVLRGRTWREVRDAWSYWTGESGVRPRFATLDAIVIHTGPGKANIELLGGQS